MGTFRNPVGPLPSNVYWRRRLVMLGIPLFLIAMVAYACTGTSGTPQGAAKIIHVGPDGHRGGPYPKYHRNADNLMFFSGGNQFTITARCADDVVTDPTALPLPSNQACVVSRAIPDTAASN